MNKIQEKLMRLCENKDYIMCQNSVTIIMISRIDPLNKCGGSLQIFTKQYINHACRCQDKEKNPGIFLSISLLLSNKSYSKECSQLENSLNYPQHRVRRPNKDCRKGNMNIIYS